MADGTVDLDPTGGVSPYTVSGSGPTFLVIDEIKNHSHPQFGQGARPDGFTIDGVQGKELTLIRGITYTFSVMAPSHAFFISTSSVGGPANLASEVTHGVTNSMVSTGTLTFTPDNTHPNLLFYQCGIHDYMGWKIRIVDQGFDGDLSECMAGNYSLIVTDVNGCNSQLPVDFTINEPAAQTFYYDNDGDSYGTSAETALSCNAPPGFSSESTDCDDNDAMVNPGMTDICSNGIDDDCDGTIDNGICGTTVNIKLLIEGFYVGSGVMVASPDPVGNPNICDTVILEIAEAVSPYNVLFSGKGVIDIHGNGSFFFNQDLSGVSYYIAVKHRNAIHTWSASPVLFSPVTSYDFTASQSQAFGGNMVNTSDNMGWAFYSGDISDALTSSIGVQDGVIESQDYSDLENALSVILVGYVPQDVTGDGVVESADYSMMENNVYFTIVSITP
jgi:hypothetical protein